MPLISQLLMTVFLTVFDEFFMGEPVNMRSLTLFNIIARYVERMVSIGAATMP